MHSPGGTLETSVRKKNKLGENKSRTAIATLLEGSKIGLIKNGYLAMIITMTERLRVWTHFGGFRVYSVRILI